jgi:hypothetical protein
MTKADFLDRRSSEIADQIQDLPIATIARLMAGLEMKVIEARVDREQAALASPDDRPAHDRALAIAGESRGFDLFDGRDLPVVAGGYGTMPNPGGRRAGQE